MMFKGRNMMLWNQATMIAAAQAWVDQHIKDPPQVNSVKRDTYAPAGGTSMPDGFIIEFEQVQKAVPKGEL
jgi:hypothetical protein